MKSRLVAIAFLTAGLLPLAAHADLPGNHPAYLHAISDLRDARWNLEHRPGDARVSAHENNAVSEIDIAIREARRAAAEDGKNLVDRPPGDANIDRRGRLHHAAEFLRKARSDVAREEDNPEARRLRRAVVDHIENAIRETDRAIRDVELGR